MLNKLLIRILLQLLPVISPALRQALISLLAQLSVAAKKTDNPWDDILVEILENILTPGK